MPDYSWLVIRFEAPLISFGGAIIDHMGITRDFPAVSMLTGLLGNVLGFWRTEREKHQSLQDRLVFAVGWNREEPTGILTDMQNAQLFKHEKGWMTYGRLEKRAGGNHIAPHRRRREYFMDAKVKIVLRLEPELFNPTLDQLSEAIQRPARPLFIGRKFCLPTAPLFERFVCASNAYTALASVKAKDGNEMRAFWPVGEGPNDGQNVDRIIDLADLRNWQTGLHGGTRQVVEGRIIGEEVEA